MDGYVIEGHVPATDVRRLLVERPFTRGLVVSGMPVGSPRMEMGNRHGPYAVLTLGGESPGAVFGLYPDHRL